MTFNGNHLGAAQERRTADEMGPRVFGKMTLHEDYYTDKEKSDAFASFTDPEYALTECKAPYLVFEEVHDNDTMGQASITRIWREFDSETEAANYVESEGSYREHPGYGEFDGTTVTRTVVPNPCLNS